MLSNKNPDILNLIVLTPKLPLKPIGQSQSFQFQHFEYSSFSLPNSKVKFIRGTPSHTPVIPYKKKCETSFDSPFSMSSEEYEHFEKTDKNEEQLQMKPLETILNALFYIDEELEDELKVQEKDSVRPP